MKVGVLRRWALLPLAALLLTLLGTAPTPAQAQSDRQVWARINGVSADVLFEDIFMSTPELAWAVGRSPDDRWGYVYRLQLIDGRWRVEQEVLAHVGLYGVAVVGTEEVWAVGANGLILRRSASGAWSQETAPTPTATLRDIQVLGTGSEAWVVGDRSFEGGRRPVALHFRNGSWERALIGGPDEGSYSVHAIHLNGGGGWAVGSLIWRLVGGAWEVETMPNLCGGSFGCANSFAAVRAIDADRAWAAGSYSANCAICSAKIGLAYREGGAWRDGLGPNGWSAVIPAAPAQPDTHYLTDLYFTHDTIGLAVGYRNYGTADGGRTSEIFGLRYVNGGWSYEQILAGATETPSGLFMADPTRALLVGSGGLIMSYGYGPQIAGPGNPAERVPNPNQPDVLYFPETGHTLRGVFRAYWERYGGLEQFGYPISEEYGGGINAEGGTSVQYFERARFEYHPEYAGTRYEVLLGLLGNEIAAPRRHEQPFVYNPMPTGQPGSVYFPETGHTMAAEFVGYWNRYGGLPIYGYPISEAFYEVNQADGKTYLVQYFERNRFEYHPEYAGTRYEVLLGLLGNETLRQRGWLR